MKNMICQAWKMDKELGSDIYRGGDVLYTYMHVCMLCVSVCIHAHMYFLNLSGNMSWLLQGEGCSLLTKHLSSSSYALVSQKATQWGPDVHLSVKPKAHIGQMTHLPFSPPERGSKKERPLLWNINKSFPVRSLFWNVSKWRGEISL